MFMLRYIWRDFYHWNKSQVMVVYRYLLKKMGWVSMSDYSVVLAIGSILILTYYIGYTILKT